MTTVMDFSFNINLQWISSLNIAIILWESPDIKEKIKLFFNEKHINESKENERWVDITRAVINEMNLVGLPEHLAYDLHQKVTAIGLNTYNWINHVTKNLKFDISAVDTIYYTSYGTVNQSKIFRDIWSKDHDLFTSNKFSWVYVACVTGSLDILNEHADVREEILNTNHSYADIKISNPRRYRLMICSLKYLNYDVNRNQDKVEWLNPKKKSDEANLFRICLLEGSIDGVKYFWKKMTDVEKKENIIFGILKCLKIYQRETYLRQNYVGIFIFFLNNASSQVLEKVLNNCSWIGDILFLLLRSWPWQEFYIPLVRQKLKNLGVAYLNEELYLLAVLIQEEVNLGHDISKSVYQNYFRKLWRFEIPAEEKKERCLRKSLRFEFKYTLEQLLRVHDFTSFKSVFNCISTESYRMDLLVTHEWLEVFRDWVVSEKFDVLERFMNEVLISNFERSYFKRDVLKFYSNLIKSELLDITDKLLDWQKIFDEDKNLLKSRIDANEICQHFVEKGNYAFIDKFLEWYFNSSEEIIDFKKDFGTGDFFQDTIMNYWTDEVLSDKNSVRGRTFVEIARQKSIKLLAFFLDFKEILEFKKKVIKDECIFDEMLVLSSICEEKYSNNMIVLEGFFNFCTNDSREEMIKVKHFLKNDLNFWITKIAVTTFYRFDLAQSLVDWIAKDKNEKIEIIQNYMSALRAVALCNSLLRRNVYKNSQFRSFLNTWVKPCKNISEIKRNWQIGADALVASATDLHGEVQDFVNVDSVLLINTAGVGTVREIILCFEKLERGKFVELSDISLR